MGLSLVPACFAAALRLTIPESPRFTLDVTDNIAKAFDEADRFNNANLEPEWVRLANQDAISSVLSQAADEDEDKEAVTVTTTDVLDIDQSKIGALIGAIPEHTHSAGYLRE